MRGSFLALLIPGFLLATGPVFGQSVRQPGTSIQLPDVALPPPLDRVLRDYERAWRAGDAVALASLFAEDGFVLQSNRPAVRGRAAIRAAYVGQAGAALRLRAFAFSSGDSTAFIIGGYGYGDGPGDTGKFTLTLRRAPGEPWVIFSDMDNLDAPPRQRSASDALPQPIARLHVECMIGNACAGELGEVATDFDRRSVVGAAARLERHTGDPGGEGPLRLPSGVADGLQCSVTDLEAGSR